MVGAKCGGYACAWDLRLVVNVPNAALSAAKYRGLAIVPVGHDVARIALVPCEVVFVLPCFCVIFRYFEHNESRGRSFQDW